MRAETRLLLICIAMALVGTVVTMFNHERAIAPQDYAGTIPFRVRWSRPPVCVVSPTETELRFYCVQQ